MIEKIIHKKKLFALIVRSKFRNKTGVNFFTHEAIFLLSYKNFEPIKIKSSKKVFAKNSVIAN